MGVRTLDVEHRQLNSPSACRSYGIPSLGVHVSRHSAAEHLVILAARPCPCVGGVIFKALVNKGSQLFLVLASRHKTTQAG